MRKIISKKGIRRIKIIFFLLTFNIGIYISFILLNKSKIELNDKELVQLVTNSTFNNRNTLIDVVVSETIDKANPIKVMNKKYSKYMNEKSEDVSIKIEPMIYIYNTHQGEEYYPSSFSEFSVNPTVIMNDYILEDIFNKNGYHTIVEEESIKDILNNNNWNYVNSYKASRILLERRIIEYPSLKYFIDIHRDSLKKDKTTISIDGLDYAKILFIVGLENPNYNLNLEFTEKINNKINELYPNLSKGIYKKSGEGVNGVYNQDFSPYTILVEVGGMENTTDEVLNTILAFSKCFMEIINE